MPLNKPIIGIDLGGTNMQLGVVSPDRKLLSTAKRKTKADEGQDAVIGRIIDGIDEACSSANIHRSELAAIGIGAAVLLLGSTLMVLARRRAKLATTDVAGE